MDDPIKAGAEAAKPEHVDMARIAMHAIFALVGGVVHEVSHGKSVSVVKFIAGGAVGSFTGVLVYFICLHFQLGEYLTIALVGLGGYTGTPLLDILSAIAKKFVGKKLGLLVEDEQKKP